MSSAPEQQESGQPNRAEVNRFKSLLGEHKASVHECVYGLDGRRTTVINLPILRHNYMIISSVPREDLPAADKRETQS